MVLNQAMEAALNSQIRNEMESAYAYLSMAAYLERKDHPGIAHWMKTQAQEELAHAMRFYDFVLDRGGRVVLQAVPQPASEFGSVLELFQEFLKHEQKITADIDNLYALALTEKDFASQPFIQTFLVEQIEEEKTASQWLAMVQMAGNDGRSLFLLDREMAGRAV